MKRIFFVFNKKKIFVSAVSVALAVVLLVTSLPAFNFEVGALDEATANPTTQTGYDSVLHYQRERWNTILKDVFGNTVRQVADDYNFEEKESYKDVHAPRRSEIINNTVQVQDDSQYFSWADDSIYGNNNNTDSERNVALGADCDAPLQSPTTNYNAKLTDGVAADTFTWEANQWYGLHHAGDNTVDGVGTVVLDFGAVQDISEVSVHFFGSTEAQFTGAGIGAPATATVYTSSDGSGYTKLGDIPLPSNPTAAFWATLSGVSASARYVKLTITGTKSWTFLNEIRVTGTGIDVWDGTYYPASNASGIGEDKIAYDYLTAAQNNIETVVYPAASVEGGDGKTYTTGAQTVSYEVFDVRTVEELQFAMRYARIYAKHVKINLLNDLDMNGENFVWETQHYEQLAALTESGIDYKFLYYADDSGAYVRSGDQFVEATSSSTGQRYSRQYYNTHILTSGQAFDDTYYGKYLYIEGNGHTIYNMKTTGDEVYDGYITNQDGTIVEDKISTDFRTTEVSGSTGFIGRVSTKALVMKNLNFESSLVFSRSAGAAVAVSLIQNRAYLENVNVDSSFIYDTWCYASTVVGWNYSSNGSLFVRNCSSSDSIVFGNFHSGGFMACQHNQGDNITVNYDTSFPESPESWLTDENKYCDGTLLPEDCVRVYDWTESHKQHRRRFATNFSNYAIYPEIIENCYSVNCEVFSMDAAGDSGAFISCGGKLICRNSFTNNTIYGNIRTGAFIGRIVTAQSRPNGMYDDSGATHIIEETVGKGNVTAGKMVEAYFENCFASGSIEGQEEIGGFTGYEQNGNVGSYRYDYCGVTVYKNCYSTAMVGMDYAGDYLGGFIGREQTNVTQKATIIVGEDENGNPIYNSNTGSVYINCYAAGEVGNILTDDSTTPAEGANYQGGFLGGAAFDDADGDGYPDLVAHGNYINCYYDKQTTAMHERAVGIENQFATLRAESSQIPGVEGLYTQTSESKGVRGLTDTQGIMNDDSVWVSVSDDTYPAFKNLSDADLRASLFRNACYATDANSTTKARIDSTLAEKDETVKQFSLASVSTVLLSHWDQVMNVATGEIGTENNKKPGLAQNMMTYNEETGYWEITYENVAAGTYDFKVQEGDSWSYEFGQGGFKGDYIPLTVEREQSDVKIKFKYYDSVISLGGDTPFVISAEMYDENGVKYFDEVVSTKAGGAMLSTWRVTGSFNTPTEWDPTNSDYTMTHVGNGVFELSLALTAGDDYEFKITQNGLWDGNYGRNGVVAGENMEFDLAKDCTVIFSFNTNTGLTDIYTSTEGAISGDYTKESRPAQFTGYSLIGPTAITGYNWYGDYNALTSGQMDDEDGDGIYEKSFRVAYQDADGNSQFNKLYGYKVVENAVDNDEIFNFYLRCDDDNFTGVAELEFWYNPNATDTAKSGVSFVGAYDVEGNRLEEYDSEISASSNVVVSKYSVLGSQLLTGFDWDIDDKENAAANGEMAYNASTGLYTKTYTNVPAGEHEFKVVGDGSFDSGIAYGENDGSGENYSINLKAESDVTISFDPVNKIISVEAADEDALVIPSYVVSCTKSLCPTLNESWSVTDCVMTRVETEGKYTYTFSDLEVGHNFSFKVLPYGVKDDSKPINSFRIAGSTDEKYSLQIDYYNKTGITVWHLINADGEDVTASQLLPPLFESYSVLGETKLTGNDWLEGTGVMDSIADGIYQITFADVAVDAVSQIFEFKIVPDGSWESGISYGNAMGGNYRFAMANPEVTSCDVTITFNEHTKEISVITTPDCINTVDENSFIWYIAGDYQLASNLNLQVSPLTYDTVRDITAKFSFTGRNTHSMQVDWAVNYSRNESNNLYNYIGTTEDGTGFDLQYTVDGKEITGEFNQPIVKIDYNEEDGYYCKEFMPGKNWITVTCVDTAVSGGIDGNRDIRLIPMAYLEAGNDASVKVMQAASDTDAVDAKNNVTLNENANSGISFKQTNASADDYVDDTVIVTKRVYFKNTYGWQVPHCYSWGGIQAEDTAGGNQMPLLAGTEDIYFADIPIDRTGISFTNGSTGAGNQTADLVAPLGSGYLWDGESWQAYVTNYSGDYYIAGYINLNDTKDIYPELIFDTGGKLTYTFAEDSYIYVRSIDGTKEYFTEGFDETATSATLYTNAESPDKLKIPAGEWDISIVENADGTLTLSYTEAAKDTNTDSSYDPETGTRAISDVNFKYYNIALTAAYGITDQVALGYYGNYSKQIVQDYDTALAIDRPLMVDGAENCHTFYMMTSVFTNKSAEQYKNAAYYTDENINLFTNTLAQEGTTNLSLDTPVEHALIGDSNADGKVAKTIIKVYKKENTDGVISWSKLSFDADSSSGATEYYSNYLKWTGQKAFADSDVGDYKVVYYWSLADGRYLEDEKYVTVASYDTDVVKSVDKKYIEKDDPDSSTRDITYTLEYTNRIKGDFVIDDILPYDGDYRQKDDGVISSSVDNATSFTFKNFSYEVSSNNVKIDNTYYYASQGDEIKVDSSGTAPEENTDLDSLDWQALTGSFSGEDVKAIRVAGRNTTGKETKITVKYTLTVSFDSELEKFDRYVNNAFYTVTENSTGQTVDGYSNHVLTAIVARSVDGYVWCDENLNGRFDDDEMPITGVVAKLYKLIDGKYVEDARFGSCTSNEEGFYSFPNIYDGNDIKNNFRVVFVAPENADGTDNVIIQGETDAEDEVVSFSELFLTRRMADYHTKLKNQSRNVSRLADEGADYSYYINQSLPSGDKIVQHNNDEYGSEVLYNNGIIRDYKFIKNYQNLGLAKLDPEAQDKSLTIKKVDEQGNPLEGVTFSLEWRENETDTYKPLQLVKTAYSGGDTPEETVPSESTTATPEASTMTIYFQNNWQWSDICIHYWGSATASDTTWRGDAMTFFKNDGTNDVYMATVPADITGMVISGIKNDGSGAVDQTPDITENLTDGICFYMMWDNGNQVGTLTDYMSAEPLEAAETASAQQSTAATAEASEVNDPVPDVYTYDLGSQSAVIQYFTTNETGTIIFKGLKTGDYKLKEVSTVEGYHLLSDEINFMLPCAIDTVTLPDKVDISKNESVDENDSNVYYDITYTITNLPFGLMPITGYNGYLPYILGLGAIALGAVLTLTLVLCHRRQKGRHFG